MSDGDIERLVLTPGYRALLAASGTIKGARLINGLVDAELETCARVLDAAVKALQALIEHWPLTERFVVADCSFCIRNPDRLEEVDLQTDGRLRSGGFVDPLRCAPLGCPLGCEPVHMVELFGGGVRVLCVVSCSRG
ncbi:hypothetical protein ABZV75_10420 [Streptomyces flaveolus]|uniref:hypothetical protein n=1 Tax=Streptomyces flaveolus TaxID=67297 RepID=UPI0033B78266